MKLLYLDESGDHNLEKIDPRYPVFVLGGVIVDRTYARTVVHPRLRQLKVEFFGNPGIVLHTSDILRARNGFEALTEAPFRARFYDALNVLMRELEYQVVACVIDKPRLIARYGMDAENPYEYGLGVLLEQFCRDLGEDSEEGIIYAERRGEPLDHELNVAWERLRSEAGGTINFSGETIEEDLRARGEGQAAEYRWVATCRSGHRADRAQGSTSSRGTRLGDCQE